MDGRSIFSGVIRNENAHTELLGNLLRRSSVFQAMFYEYITGIPRLPEKPCIEVQLRLEEDGQPDLTFEFCEAPKTFIEVKVRSSCATTNNQTGAAGRGYHLHGDLYFLAPRNWVHAALVKAPIRTWEGLALRLAKHLSRAPETREDWLLHEYLMFLDLEFPSIYFTKEEIYMLTTQDEKVTVTSAIKLHRTVASLAEWCKEAEWCKKAACRVEKEVKASENGFNIKSRESKPLLWVGMWNHLLLGIGFKSSWHEGLKIDGFVPMEGYPDWQVLSLNHIVRSDGVEVVSAAFEKIKSALHLIEGWSGGEQTVATPLGLESK